MARQQKRPVIEDGLASYLPEIAERREKKAAKTESRGESTGEKIEGSKEETAPAPSFTPAIIQRLLEEAAEEAGFPQGREDAQEDEFSQDLAQGSRHATEADSQKFHLKVQPLIQDFFARLGASSTVADVGPLLCQVLKLCYDDQGCRPRPMAGKSKLFPLPASTCAEFTAERQFSMKALVMALNDFYGEASPDTARGNPTSFRAMKRMAAIVRSSGVLGETIPQLEFQEYMENSKVDYQGEEVKVAKKITWKAISPSLPKEVGCLQLRDFCEGGVLHFIDHFTDFLVPESERTIGKAPRVMVEPEEWPIVAKGLVDKGLCTVVKESELFKVSGSPLVNGMFAVGKQEFLEDGTEICRLIMNLKPINNNSLALEGDTPTLPSVTSLGNLWLDESQSLCVCSEDIRCFFYLFRVPQAWIPHLGFGLVAPQEITPKDFGGEKGYLCSVVLPMGYLNSVGIAQHVHRVVVRRSLASLERPLGGEAELRRDRPFSQADNLFRIYLDNFDQLRKVDSKLAKTLEGSLTEEVKGLRETYTQRGLPIHPKKSVVNKTCAEVQGAWIDGDQGTACAKPPKIARYLRLALELMGRGKASQKELQIVGGGLVYIAMYRRPLLSGLNQIWSMITSLEGAPKSRRIPLRREVICELARFLALIPLGFMNFRLEFDEQVSASDASTTGGGLVMSRGLTPYGQAASLASVRGEVAEDHDFHQILSIGLFDGISALRVALDTLGLPVAGHVSVEQDPRARRVVEAYFADTLFVEDVKLVDEDMVKHWSLRFSAVAIVLVGAGPPCQGVSGLNCDRKGAMRDHRSSLFSHVPRIVAPCQKFFPWAQIHFLAENVSSMDYVDCNSMNEGYGCLPWFIDAHQVSPCHRPRLYWCSWELFEGDGASLVGGSDGRLPIAGEVLLQASIEEKSYFETGWTKEEGKSLPTFTTSRPSSKPLRRPAGLKTCNEEELARWRNDLHRFPPYQYRKENCLTNRAGEHRPPSISEREVCLGFPLHFTKQCMAKQFHETEEHRDCRLSLLGNSWSVPVVCWILSRLFVLLGLMDEVSVQELVDRLKPGGSSKLSTLLLRPPLGFSTSTLSSSKLLVRKLCGLVSLKGEDLMLQGTTEPPVKYQRLRAGVPAKLWRWRTISGWKWTGAAEHINVLELRAVLTSIKYRVEVLHQQDLRCVHLVDSLVVLHALTRGRSSSRKMRRTMMRVNAYLLASGLQPLWGYVSTDQNPADRPSRRYVKKKWLKR